MKWVLVLTFRALGGIVPRHLFRRAGVWRARDVRIHQNSFSNEFEIFRSFTVANSPQAKKRARQNEKNRKHNASLRSMARTYVKKVQAKIEAGNYEEAQAAFQQAQPVMDSMVNKGIFAKNKVARQKSRLSAKIKALKSA
jgi:small subunit ribosomal protein S20